MVVVSKERSTQIAPQNETNDMRYYYTTDRQFPPTTTMHSIHDSQAQVLFQFPIQNKALVNNKKDLATDERARGEEGPDKMATVLLGLGGYNGRNKVQTTISPEVMYLKRGFMMDFEG